MCGILLQYSHTTVFSENDVKQMDMPQIPSIIANDLKNELHPQSTKDEHPDLFQSLVPKILARGSDYCSYKIGKLPNVSGSYKLFSSVLSLRSPLTQQPLQLDDRFTIQFNGELYNKELLESQQDLNDVYFLHSKLIEFEYDVIKTIGYIEGEFAYSLIDHEESKIYFGKDILGKKSLCYNLTETDIVVSSCSPSTKEKYDFIECLNGVIYTYDIKTNKLDQLDFNSTPEKLPSKYTLSDPSRLEEPRAVELITEYLTSSVRSRIETIHPVHPSKARFALLFSGGIDCTLLAAISAEISPPGTIIDLLNVSFENPRTKTKSANTPDRKLAIKNWVNLSLKYPHVKFQLVEADISYDEYLLHKPRVINLIYPNDTEMDLSIAIAFYFASRGVGNQVIFDPSITDPTSLEREPYNSDVKVLLSGLGADELFGGYTRHERIMTYYSNQIKRKEIPKGEQEYYESELKPKVIEELQVDLNNLYIRNLSRDDKVISCWSKELRYPFLDHHFIKFVTEQLSINEFKMHLNLETGELVRKRGLRLLAKSLGLNWVADEAKRAIQFGSKSAKMEVGSSKVKGTDKLS